MGPAREQSSISGGDILDGESVNFVRHFQLDSLCVFELCITLHPVALTICVIAAKYNHKLLKVYEIQNFPRHILKFDQFNNKD